MKLISVVLSGGAGTRLWPASRQAYPKPFMKLGGSALLEQAIARGQACGTDDLLVVTNQDHLFLTQNLVAEMAQPPTGDRASGFPWERAPARECWLELLQAFGRRGGLPQVERCGAARWRRAAVRMLWAGLAVLGLLGFEALPHALLRPLENRYPVPPPEAVGRHVGVIVLGGATEHPGIYMAHGQVTPYPVDFRTGDATLWAEYSLARSLLLWQTALHEWLG